MGSYTGTIPTFLAGEILDADKLTELANFATAACGAWTTYTPVWTTAGTAPSLGNGTLTGAYRRLGKTVELRIKWLSGSTTTYGTSQWFFSLPFAALSAAQLTPGACRVFDTGTANRAGTAFIISTLDKVAMIVASQDVTNTQPQTFASGDEVQVSMVYETA